MAVVHGIRIYPVKGFDPLAVDEALMLPSGALQNDRRWALVDSRGRFVNGKNYAAIHSIRAVFAGDVLTVTVAGQTFPLGDPAFARCVSDLLGEPVELREDAARGFPDDTESPGPTLVSTASLETLASWFGLSLEQARLRFRANIEVSDVPAFWEDQLYGSDVRLGEAVLLHAVNPCQRCVVPSRDALTGEQDAGFQKRFAELRREAMPAWARTAQFNHYYRFAVNTRLAAGVAGGGRRIRVGDVVNEGS